MTAKKNGIVISPPVETGGFSYPVEGRVIGKRMNLHTLPVSKSGASRKSVYEGLLMKRCRVSV